MVFSKSACTDLQMYAPIDAHRSLGTLTMSRHPNPLPADANLADTHHASTTAHAPHTGKYEE